MPPKKRKASGRIAATPNKKARVAEEPEPALTSRPKRKSVGKPHYDLTKRHKKANDGPQAQDIAPEPETVVPKRRGRPPKEKLADTINSTPAKSPPAGRPRGRPKSQTATAKSVASKVAPKPAVTAATGQGRGRPRKIDVPVKTARQAVQKASTKASKTQTTKAIEPEAPAKGTSLPRRRGRPSKSNDTIVSISDVLPDTDSGTDIDDAEITDEEHGERQYWLMKAEPNDRLENGVNVKFSIDDLAAAEVPEPWDGECLKETFGSLKALSESISLPVSSFRLTDLGVRNFGARNHMRAMRKGDLAFFYHSNCPVPGIVGMMRIVQEHTPDQSAFDPNHPYYDPKSSPNNPKWDCVHVEFLKKFDLQVTLKMMQENKAKSGELAGMQLLKMGRLSVSAVSPKEWAHILGMANEDVDIGETDSAAVHAEGYESDTDGEVDGGPREELNGDIAAATTTAEDEMSDGNNEQEE